LRPGPPAAARYSFAFHTIIASTTGNISGRHAEHEGRGRQRAPPATEAFPHEPGQDGGCRAGIPAGRVGFLPGRFRSLLDPFGCRPCPVRSRIDRQPPGCPVVRTGQRAQPDGRFEPPDRPSREDGGPGAGRRGPARQVGDLRCTCEGSAWWDVTGARSIHFGKRRHHFRRRPRIWPRHPDDPFSRGRGARPSPNPSPPWSGLDPAAAGSDCSALNPAAVR